MNKRKIKILEIGCGNGFLLDVAKENGYQNIYGLEPSRDAVTQSSKSVRKDIKIGMLSRKSFPARNFDVICAFQVFDHISNPNNFLSICQKLLKPQGKIVLMNHDVESWSAKFFAEKSPIFDIEHPYLYCKKTIQAILKKNNYSIVNIYSPPSLMTLRYILRLLPLPTIIKSRLIKLKTGLLDINLKIFPGNHCVVAIKD